VVQVLISGGGIGGLSAALAASRAGCDVRLFECTPAFSEVGAGIQLGPNVTRVLHGWGLADALAAVAASPERLQVRSAVSGQLLGELKLGADMAARYGAPYATLHRADLHALLLNALGPYPDAKLHLDRAVSGFSQTPQSVTVQLDVGTDVEGDVLVGSDGLWSSVRQQLLGDGPPRATGYLAYRALILQQALPENLRSQNVTVWLGPKMHVVQYPVRGGQWLNLVAIVHGSLADDFENWNHKPDGTANAAALLDATTGSCSALLNLLLAVPASGKGWGVWALHDRPPMQGAYQHALGRVALLGDAAHPMLPYLAQGAGMAIEDAAELGHVLKLAQENAVFDMPTLLQRYALNRWQRNARVQARAIRNGTIFHASGPLRLGRDMALSLLGEKLLDVPWLYGFTPKAS
jgi:salicylate hydroxylase